MGKERREQMRSLGTELPTELARVRKVLGQYKEIGPSGQFGAMIIEDLLRRTDAAMIEGDTVTLISLYQELKEVN
jgi:hypothetical protein